MMMSELKKIRMMVIDDNNANSGISDWNYVNYCSAKANKSKIPPIFVDFSVGGFGALFEKLKRTCMHLHLKLNEMALVRSYIPPVWTITNQLSICCHVLVMFFIHI